MYSIRDYGAMIADEHRLNGYRYAIDKVVRPGDVFLELGCGPGLFALLASKTGARKVYAIESEDAVQFARELAAANGCGDRIEFIHGDSRKTELPERVDVIVSDLRGVLPLFDHAIDAVEDARRRFLAPGGLLIPQRDTLKAALVDAAEYYCHLTGPWRTAVPGTDLSAALPIVLNTSYSVHFKREQLLTEPCGWVVLNYAIGAMRDVSAELTFTVERAGTAHGLCLWFDAQLLEDIGFSSGPGAVNSVYGQMFFPWLDNVTVQQGQEICVRLQADLVGDDYVWQWETRIPANEFGAERHFKQSTLQGAVLSPESLRRRAADFVPALSESGQADRWLLQAVDGKASLQEIAQAAAQRFPKIFRRWEDALHRAADLAAEFSR